MSALIWCMHAAESLQLLPMICWGKVCESGSKHRAGGGGRGCRDHLLATLHSQLFRFIHTKLKSNPPMDDCLFGDTQPRCWEQWTGACFVGHCPSKMTRLSFIILVNSWGVDSPYSIYGGNYLLSERRPHELRSPANHSTPGCLCSSETLDEVPNFSGSVYTHQMDRTSMWQTHREPGDPGIK